MLRECSAFAADEARQCLGNLREVAAEVEGVAGDGGVEAGEEGLGAMARVGELRDRREGGGLLDGARGLRVDLAVLAVGDAGREDGGDRQLRANPRREVR